MSSARPNTWIIIAAYNEGRVIGDVVRKLKQEFPNVIVVNDGSSDATGPEATRAGAMVITHPVNLGQGAALQTGLELALKRRARFIVTFDGDGQHDGRDIDRMLDGLEGYHADYALGSRFLIYRSNVPYLRSLLLQIAVWFTRVTTGLRITDTHNGLRAMTLNGATHISLRQNRMAHASELLSQISASGLPYIEVPVHVNYSDYSLAKGQRLTGAVDIIIDLFAERMRR